MLKLLFNGEEIVCDRSVKGVDYIHCFINNPNPIAEFNHISNFSGYSLVDKNGNKSDFDLPMPTASERLAAAESALLALMTGGVPNV